MEITVFSKKRKTRDGKTFPAYIAKLTKKDGTALTAAVKFREECGQPDAKHCPMNIIVDKNDANLSVREYVREDTGDIANSYTLWVSDWQEGPEYVDTSLDDFD